MITTHAIGELFIRTDSDIPIPHLQNGLYAHYLARSDEPSDICIRIRGYDPNERTCAPLDPEERSKISRSIGFPERWQDHEVFRVPEIRQALRRGMEHPELMLIALVWNRIAIIHYGLSEYHIFYPPERRSDFLDPLLIAGFRNLFSIFLPNFAALMVHSAGVIYREKCAVFLAPDEGGKTTVTRSLPSGTILSDDNLIFRTRDERITVHSTPFGELGNGPCASELHGLFLLNWGERFEISCFPQSKMFEFLWNERSFLRYIIPPNMRSNVFYLLHGICDTVPTYQMTFEKNDIQWDEILGCLAH